VRIILKILNRNMIGLTAIIKCIRLHLCLFTNKYFVAQGIDIFLGDTNTNLLNININIKKFSTIMFIKDV